MNWLSHLHPPKPDHVSLPLNTLILQANVRTPECSALAAFSLALCWIAVFTLRSACSCHPAPPEIMPKPQTVLTGLGSC